MKLNKTAALIAIIAGGVLTSGGLQAQDTAPIKPAAPAAGEAKPSAPSSGMRPAMAPEKIAKAIGLNDEQTAKFLAAMEERKQKVADLRADTSVAQSEKRPKMKAITEATNTKLKGFMTPEQFEKYTKMTPGPRNRPGVAAPGGNAPMPVPEKPTANTGK